MVSEKYLRLLNWLFELLKGALLILILGLFVHYFIFTIFIVDGSSMEPSFKDGQYLIVNRLAYLFEKPKRGDVVILRFPGREKEKYIKRVIGLPNETVEIKDGSVFINGEKLNETYLKFQTQTEPALTETLSENEYFLLGDNRANSNDSRIWGNCPKENIIGKPVFILYPLSDWGPVSLLF